MNEFYRGRRLRRNPVIREMVRETQLSAADLMMLYFVVDTTDEDFKKEIPSMPGQYQLSLKQLEKTVGEAVDAGLRSLMLFGIPKHKDAIASEAYAPNGIVQRAIRMLKAKWPDLQVVTDVCLCEYTSHGHCGILKEGDTCGEVVNDPTLELLAKTALSHVEAGADMVAPSDMMDGRILAIRETLDKAGYVNTPIMSYAVKYASAFYGPFRDAAESAASRRPQDLSDGPRQRDGRLARSRRRHRRGRGHRHGEARRSLSGRHPHGARQLRRAGRRLSGERRVLHDQGRRHQRLDR